MELTLASSRACSSLAPDLETGCTNLAAPVELAGGEVEPKSFETGSRRDTVSSEGVVGRVTVSTDSEMTFPPLVLLFSSPL